MISFASSDREVELWLAKHRQDVANVTTAELLEVAEWLPIIGVPANDRTSGCRHERLRSAIPPGAA